ncbi:MAG: hypothetical protein M3Y22_00960 [Pseudomonadota bacterium]|nr:hypothetical protein [Pseudomonadota bacterium]
MTDATIDILVRKARMAAAIADRPAACRPWIALMEAGVGAELVARQMLSREILAMRLQRDADRGPDYTAARAP